MIKTVALFLITLTSSTATTEEQISYEEVTVTAAHHSDAYLICRTLGEQFINRDIDTKYSYAYLCESDTLTAGRLRYRLHRDEKKETE